MDIPEKLKENINELLKEKQLSRIVEDAKIVSNRYRNNDGNGNKMLTKKSEAVSYAISRMPATYAAVRSVVKQTMEICNTQITSVIDVGAGTGAAMWAVSEELLLNSMICLEREENMISIGKRLMLNTVLDNVKWEKFDITQNNIIQKADLVIMNYLKKNEKKQYKNYGMQQTKYL